MLNQEKKQVNPVTATYSPEDNKLRLYPTFRLDQETYDKVKAAGFRWAPKQSLFVAPMWTVAREDLCLELAGEIEPEETTIAERAEAKAARIDGAIEKKKREADAYSRAADNIAERFHFGQPILVGHHSERKARRDQEKMHRAMSNASSCIKKVQYLADKAYGVECHANYKNRSDVRARRIKTLLAELRDVQRRINHGHIIKETWEGISGIEDTEKRRRAAEYYSGMHLSEGPLSPRDTYSDLRSGKIEPDEAIRISLEYAEKWINDPNQYRWIEHVLNRLSYERGELGQTRRYEGNMREVILQSFAREQGAHKPEAHKTESGFLLKCPVPLPLHIADGKEIELTEDAWRDLMQSTGYEVPEKTASGKSDQPPLLNLDVAAIKGKGYGTINQYGVVRITREQFSRIWKDHKGVRVSSCGGFRFRVGRDPHSRPGEYGQAAFFITDSKAHNIPDSEAVVMEQPNE